MSKWDYKVIRWDLLTVGGSNPWHSLEKNLKEHGARVGDSIARSPWRFQRNKAPPCSVPHRPSSTPSLLRRYRTMPRRGSLTCSGHVIAAQIDPWGTAMLRRHMREGSLFRENAAGAIGL